MMESPLQKGPAERRPSRLRSRGATDEPMPALTEVEGPTDEAGADETAVHYYFPVEVEVRAAPEAVDTDDIVRITLERLAARLENS
jgi:hypothetical protein